MDNLLPPIPHPDLLTNAGMFPPQLTLEDLTIEQLRKHWNRHSSGATADDRLILQLILEIDIYRRALRTVIAAQPHGLDSDVDEVLDQERMQAGRTPHMEGEGVTP